MDGVAREVEGGPVARMAGDGSQGRKGDKGAEEEGGWRRESEKGEGGWAWTPIDKGGEPSGKWRDGEGG